MPEDIESLPLYLNPMLKLLVLCLACGLFRDFKTADEIFTLEPSPDEGSYELVLSEPAVSLFRLASQGWGSMAEVSLKKQPCRPARQPSVNKPRGTPLYKDISDDGPTGKILAASWFRKELPALGRQAGYIRLITVHNIRAEALIRADNKYTMASSLCYCLILMNEPEG
jgi:hypothetical protein